MDAEQVAAYWEGNAETWTRQVRQGLDVYRDALNTPTFLALLPPVEGLTGLDIGCGEGANTRQLAQLGAHMTGIDVAPTFIRHARDAEAETPLGITYAVGDATKLAFAEATFDFATAFMSLMDMADQQQALLEAARVLKPGGFLQFSILHPCFVPPYRKTHRRADGSTRAVEVARYFDRIDGEIETWWFSTLPSEERASVAQFQIPRFHRTLSEWVTMIVTAGLNITAFQEPVATPEVAAACPTVEDTQVVPIFLHVQARKPIT